MVDIQKGDMFEYVYDEDTTFSYKVIDVGEIIELESLDDGSTVSVDRQWFEGKEIYKINELSSRAAFFVVKKGRCVVQCHQKPDDHAAREVVQS